jgi:stress response protein YsnF
MQTITAFFDNRADAERAVATLTSDGISSDSIRMVEGNDPDAASSATVPEEKGFFESLGDLFMPDDDRHSYAEGLRRGGYLVSVQTGSANVERVIDILDADGSVNMDERTESWRSEGWSGAAAGGVTSGANPAIGQGDGTIEVVEEEMRVGKRDVSHGRVRVRAYTVEDQVSEDVTLRSEKVDIVRRPVDRPIDNADAAFADRTIEVEETAEEAVISKTARVKEEIDVAKTVDNVTETVSGTVRHTEVEIEDERKGKFDKVK